MYRFTTSSTYRSHPSYISKVASTAFLVVALQQHHHSNTLRRPTVAYAMMMSTTTTTPSSSLSSTFTTTSGKKGALIFLHGLGDGSPNGWEMSLEQQLIRINSKLSSQNLVYIFPNAPLLPISINGGDVMPGWFDLYDWPIDLEAQDDEINIVKSISSTNDIIAKCMTDYHFNMKQIIVAGFSQGGAIALLTAYHPKYRIRHDTGSSSLGGCINLSGWLPFQTKLNDWNDSSLPVSTEQTTQSVPLFWGHGQYDEIVLIEHQKAGIDFLTERGLISTSTSQMNVQSLQFPVGHSSDPNELKVMADFIDRVLFTENDATTSNSSKNDMKNNVDEL